MLQKNDEPISIVIPTKNRIDDLKRCIDALYPQLSDDDEIMIINNGKPDSINDVLTPYKNKKIIVINDDEPNLPSIFNKGWKKAKSELIGFINDDAIASSNWVKNAKKWFSKIPDATCIGGMIYDKNERVLKKWFNKHRLILEMYNKFMLGNNVNKPFALTNWGTFAIDDVPPKEPNNPVKVVSLRITNMAVKKNILKEMNGFVTVFKYAHYDGYFFLELNKRQKSLYLVPGMSVDHYPNPVGATRSPFYLSRDEAIFLNLLKFHNNNDKARIMLTTTSYFLFWMFLSYRDKKNYIKEVFDGYRLGYNVAKEYITKNYR